MSNATTTPVTPITLVDSTYSWKTCTLIQFLDEGNIPTGWTEFFTMPQVRRQLEIISEDLAQEKGIVYPPIHKVFTAFYMTPLDKLKAVLIGQDPYHNGTNEYDGSAVGLCFSVRPGNQINPSLGNIYKELELEGFSVREDGDLTRWAKQGVLLLNTALTVAKGSPESHLCTWDQFTNLLIQYIGTRMGTKVYWLLFGRPAVDTVTKLLGKKGNMITASHPSPRSAYTSTSFGPAFIGSNVFKKVPGIVW